MKNFFIVLALLALPAFGQLHSATSSERSLIRSCTSPLVGENMVNKVVYTVSAGHRGSVNNLRSHPNIEDTKVKVSLQHVLLPSQSCAWDAELLVLEEDVEVSPASVVNKGPEDTAVFTVILKHRHDEGTPAYRASPLPGGEQHTYRAVLSIVVYRAGDIGTKYQGEGVDSLDRFHIPITLTLENYN